MEAVETVQRESECCPSADENHLGVRGPQQRGNLVQTKNRVQPNAARVAVGSLSKHFEVSRNATRRIHYTVEGEGGVGASPARDRRQVHTPLRWWRIRWHVSRYGPS